MSGVRAGLRDEDGNISTMYALLAPILVFASGAAVDYGRSAQIHSKLNAAADAAALAALTPAMLQQSATTAQAAAASMFQGLAHSVSGIGAITVSVTIGGVQGTLVCDVTGTTSCVTGSGLSTVACDMTGTTGCKTASGELLPNVAGATGCTTPTGASALVHNVSVAYSTSANTLFGAAIGASTLHMSGCSSASAQIPPNIDFYVLLDNSPSMALPATSAGITQMESLTRKQDGNAGCAFACHQASTNNGDTEGNPCADGTAPTQSGGLYCDTARHGAQIDNYALARNNAIALRLDELNSGVTTLLNTATTTAQTSHFATPPNYRFAVYSMDSLWQIGLTELVALAADYQSQWNTAKANFGVMEMYSNNNDCAENSACSSGTNAPGGDVATNYDDSLGKLSQTTYIPKPGNGTNQQGDTPQEVLFIVTDGVEDEKNGGRLQQTINNLGNAPGGTQFGTNWCTTIKNRGIKIAILYTDYLPVPANSWYESWIAPIQSDIGPALRACASPGLFYDAAIGSDLGGGLTTLFNAVTQSGHLTQ